MTQRTRNLFRSAVFAKSIILAGLLVMPAVTIAQAAVDGAAGKRLALIVGNSKYKSVEPLRNAVNDSRSVAEALEELGFEVTQIEDVGRAGFEKALDAFSKNAEGAEATVFYYSGHGFALGGKNYLVPVDARLRSREAIEKETLKLDEIIAELQDRNRQTLIFLDACRNNPLPKGVSDNSQGLAQIETGTGTFVAFATQPGNITRDGEGDNSQFTTAFLENVTEPGISISDMMIRVRLSVEEQTKNTQTPWDQSSLRSQFYFNPEDESLTDADRELLLSLDPALREKFVARFGLKIESVEDLAGGEEEDQPELVATIQPQVSISGGDDQSQAAAEPAPAPVLAPVAEAPVAAPDAAKPEEQTVAEAAPAPTEPAVPVAGLSITSGDETPVPEAVAEAAPSEPLAPEAVAEVAPTELPAAEPAPEAVAEAVPVAPATEPAAEPPVDVALLTPPEEAARPPLLDTITPTAPAVAESPVAVAPADTAAPVLQPATPAPDAVAVAPTAPEPQENTSRAVVTETAPSTSLAPVAAETPRVVGTEVELPGPTEQSVAAADPTPPPAPKFPAGTPTLTPVELAPVVPAPQPPVTAQEPPADTLMASVSPGDVKPDLIPNAPKTDQPFVDMVVPADLPRAIQEQLSRLGCYRSGIDGNWGSQSAKALLRYYATKKEAPDDLEPTAVLYSRLSKDEQIVCTRVESSKPKVAKASTKKPGKVAENTVKPGKKATAGTKPKSTGTKTMTAAKKKPTISMGTFR